MQFHFGGFDPRGLVISLKINCHEQESFRRFLEFLTIANDPEEVLRWGQKIFRDRIPDEDKFSAFALVSVQDHEARHFHDFLLSSWGSNVIRFRFILLWWLLDFLFNHPDDVAVGVPLSRWAEVGAEEIDRYNSKSSVRAYLELFKSKNIGKYTPRLDKNIAKAEEFYRSLNFWNTAPEGFKISPREIMEYSALAIQITSLRRTFGVEIANWFQKRVFERGTNPYMRINSRFKAAFRRENFFDFVDVVPGICLWSLCGVNEEHPSRRLRFILKNIKDRSWKALGGELKARSGETLVDCLDSIGHKSGFASLEDSFDVVSDKNDDFLSHYSAISKEAYGDYQVVHKIIEAFRQYNLASCAMQQGFLMWPTHYLQPYLYMETRHEWLSFPYTIDFLDGGFRFPKRWLKLYEVWAGQKRKDGDLAFRMLQKIPIPGLQMLDERLWVTISDYMRLCDFYFSKKNRYDRTFDLYRKVGWRPLGIEMI